MLKIKMATLTGRLLPPIDAYPRGPCQAQPVEEESFRMVMLLGTSKRIWGVKKTKERPLYSLPLINAASMVRAVSANPGFLPVAFSWCSRREDRSRTRKMLSIRSFRFTLSQLLIAFVMYPELLLDEVADLGRRVPGNKIRGDH